MFIIKTSDLMNKDMISLKVPQKIANVPTSGVINSIDVVSFTEVAGTIHFILFFLSLLIPNPPTKSGTI